MKPVILLQTDFSLTWGAVASVKGVIKQVDPTLEIEDLCHDIRKFDPWEASLSLGTVVPYWPAGTIVVSVVDPGVGTDRKACVALLQNGTYVITPDNGTLTHLKHGIGIKAVRELDPSKLPEGWTLAYDLSVPTCRSLNQPYDPSNPTTQYYSIDGLILSPNVKMLEVKTIDKGFENSDHNPVQLRFVLN